MSGMIEELSLKHFTAFEYVDIKFSPGINIFIGQNGTGKTHILKILYTVLTAMHEKKRVSDKIVSVFLPKDRNIGRLVKRTVGRNRAQVIMIRDGKRLKLSFSAAMRDTLKLANSWNGESIGSCVYIPVKEMLANAPGFLALYNNREVHFEEVYADIIYKALIPKLRGPVPWDRRKLLERIQEIMEGKVLAKEDHFYLKNSQGDLEFTLLAEGMRKLALLWLLIQNGTLLEGSVLFWDEPEANINPKIMKTLAGVLLELQRLGVQTFIATHDYVTLKEFDLQRGKDDQLSFHAMFRDDETKEIKVHTTESYLQIHPNAISDTFADLYDRDIQRALKGEPGHE